MLGWPTARYLCSANLQLVLGTSARQLPGYLPPFFEANVAIIIRVHFCEEVVQVAVRDSQTCATKRGAKLWFRYLAVAIVIDAFE
jgi:hypothetical protein